MRGGARTRGAVARFLVGDGPTLLLRACAASGAVLAAASIGLAAYASHGAPADIRAPLMLAAAMAFGHGAMLAAVAPHAVGRPAAVVVGMWVCGTLLFSGSLLARHLAGLSSALAPAGGILLMAGWLLHGCVLLRR